MLSTTLATCLGCRRNLLSTACFSYNLYFSRSLRSYAFVLGSLRLTGSPSPPLQARLHPVLRKDYSVVSSASYRPGLSAPLKGQERLPFHTENKRINRLRLEPEREYASKKPKFNPKDRPAARTAVTGHRPLSPYYVRSLLSRNVEHWTLAGRTVQRLMRIGIPLQDAKYLLRCFRDETPDASHGWFPPKEDTKWQMDRIMEEIELEKQQAAMDRNRQQRLQVNAIDAALMRRFMDWSFEKISTVRETLSISENTAKAIAAFYYVVDYTHPEEWYAAAREKRRKVIMHVGPTNSGKTHNALRALAAARLGVYASPLRLLAFEIFHRLNNGHIIPLGADPSTPPEAHKRLCNLKTGEEHRIVSPTATLLSCTIEMLDLEANFDVAIVDEVQMLSDPDRGGAWTAAILGLNAAEIHLCGEEGVVPLVQKMLEGTGDELIVQRYERLTPLVVESTSLKGDLKNVKKGDCIVTFSRSGIFDLKARIEKETKLKCAVVYGRLPPEVRAEQAELFNDMMSGYDVLIGSDAIGMGLNLKIKRIVFAETSKYDGQLLNTLSLSQLKQIAGRAGRYGLHSDEKGGTVTSLFDEDLPIVRKAVELRSLPLAKRATLPLSERRYQGAARLLPGESVSNIFAIEQACARTRPCYALENRILFTDDIMGVVDRLAQNQTLGERIRILMAPIQWRDHAVRVASERFLGMYERGEAVDIRKACEDLEMFDALEAVQQQQQCVGMAESFSFPTTSGPSSLPSPSPSSSPSSPPSSSLSSPPSFPPSSPLVSPPSSPSVTSLIKNMIDPQTLIKLESLYRIAIVYMWYNMHLPTAFHERELAVQTKEACESAIEWCLARFKILRLGGPTKTGQGREWSRGSMRSARPRRMMLSHTRKSGRNRDSDLSREEGYRSGPGREYPHDPRRRASSGTERERRETTYQRPARKEPEILGKTVASDVTAPKPVRVAVMGSA